VTNTPEPKNVLNNLQWVHIALVLILCGTIFSLVFWADQKLETISTFIIAIAGVYGAFYLRQSRQDTLETKTVANGNLARKDQEIADLQNKLAAFQRIHTQEIAQMAVQVPNTARLPESLLADLHPNGADEITSTVPLPAIKA
jgi:hypothetical protein